jgi:hypothetical protein
MRNFPAFLGHTHRVVTASGASHSTRCVADQKNVRMSANVTDLRAVDVCYL